MRADLPQRYADRVTGTGQGSSKRSGIIHPHRRLHPDGRALIFAEHQRSSASLRNNRSFLKVLRYAHGALRFQKIWGHGNGLGCINVGLMSAGESRNVIPVHAQIQMEVRGETAEINDFMVDQAVRIVKGTALAYDVQYEVEKVGEAGEMINDRELIDLVAECAHEEPTCKNVVERKKLGCSEDFTLLARRVQAHGGKAEFFVVGADRTAAHHQREFDFDETGLETAFGIFRHTLEKLNGR